MISTDQPKPPPPGYVSTEQVRADLHVVLVLLADTLRCVNVVISTAAKDAIEKGKL